jgi:hypothetical protein
MDQEIVATMKITIYVLQFHVIAIISMVKTLMNSVILVVIVAMVIGMKVTIVMTQLKILNTESMPKLTQQSVIFSAMLLKDVFPVPLKDAFNSEIIH